VDNLDQVLITLITVAGSAGVWKFFEHRMKLRAEEKKLELSTTNDSVQYRDDLKQRVSKLEKLLFDSAEEKDDLRKQILSLTQEVSTLRERVVHLEKENERLKSK
tara:strand:- start:2649 stop:2963 length:315 start_codon:yes stop_codon:yes gene_type:complete